MGIRLYPDLERALESLRTRVPKISKPDSQRFRKTLPRQVTPLLLILVSVTSGAAALHFLKRSAIEKWLIENPPKAQVWRKTLESHGYEQVTGPNLSPSYVHAILRTLPGTIDEAHRAYGYPLFKKPDWIVLFREADSDSQDLTPFIFKRRIVGEKTPLFPDPKVPWEFYGQGYIGLGAALEAFERAQPSSEAHSKTPSKTIQRPIRDSRQLEY